MKGKSREQIRAPFVTSGGHNERRNMSETKKISSNIVLNTDFDKKHVSKRFKIMFYSHCQGLNSFMLIKRN